MGLPRAAIVTCGAAAVLDLLASTLATMATLPREGTCDGALYLCSFRDLLPLAVLRVLALVVITLLTFAATRKPRQSSQDMEEARVPLLHGSDDISVEDLQAALEAEKASEGRRKAFKNTGIVACYCITVFSQIYVALKVGLFRDHNILESIASANARLGLGAALPMWTVPLGLCAAVLVVNVEAVAFGDLIGKVWKPQQYSVPSLHMHPLTYQTSATGRGPMACKSCGLGMRQGFKVAFACKKCDWYCCMSCYKRKVAQENQQGVEQSEAAAQEAEVTIFKLIALMLKLGSSEVPLVTLSLFCVFAATLVDNITPDVQGKIFSDLYGTPAPQNSILPDPGSHALRLLPHLQLSSSPAIRSFVNHLLDYLYCLLGSMALSTVQTQAFKIFGLRLTSKLQRQLFSKILAQPTEFFDSASVGDLESRVSREVPGMLSPIDTILPTTISCIGGLVVGVFFCFKYNWKLSLCCFATIPAIVHVSREYAEFSTGLWRQRFVGLGAAAAISNEAFSNIRTVHSYSTEAYEEAKYGAEMDSMLKLGVQSALGMSLRSVLNNVLGLVTSMLVLGYGGYLVLLNTTGMVDTGLDAGKLIAFQLYMNKMQRSFKTLQQQITSLTKATGAAQRVVGLMDSMPEDDAKPSIGDVPIGDVIYDNVRFSYKTRPDMEILKGLDLVIQGGSTCGVVGTSGAGKSTILSILMQFYSPTSGRVLLDGKDLATVDRRTTHRYMGIVTQDTQIFATTIEANIAYGMDNYTRADLEEAAKAAHVHSFVSTFPEGYSTRVGERGVQLSGGQRQRIALARLLIRKPKVVLLDEATSALDAESEAQVQEALDDLMAAGGRTIIIVAHRLSTVKDANSIAVMDQGQVAELGEHSALVAKGGIYANLVRRQLEGISSLDDIQSAVSGEGSPQNDSRGQNRRGRGRGRRGGRW